MIDGCCSEAAWLLFTTCDGFAMEFQQLLPVLVAGTRHGAAQLSGGGVIGAVSIDQP